MEKASFRKLDMLSNGTTLGNRAYCLYEVKPNYELECNKLQHDSLTAEAGMHVLGEFYDSNDGNDG